MIASQKILAWNDVDLILSAYANLIKSSESAVKIFYNFIEPWENTATCDETFGNEKRLLRKYKGICIFDEEETFTGWIVNVEWVKKAWSMPSHYVVSVQNLAALDNADEIYPYMINGVCMTWLRIALLKIIVLSA